MATIRALFDVASSTHLVLPDTLRIGNVSTIEETNLAMIRMSAKLMTNPVDLHAYPKARALQVMDLEFFLERPDDQRVRSFDFVKDDFSAGTIVITCALEDVVAVRGQATSHVGFFKPHYRANSEEYASNVLVATARISSSDMSGMDGIHIVSTIVALKRASLTWTNDPSWQEELVAKVVDRYCGIKRIGTIDDGEWRVQCAHNAVAIELRKIMPRTDRITGTAADMRLLVQ